MKIVFYADHPYWGQLANNGGTRTILRSADALIRLGHRVDIVAHKDRFTWFKHIEPVHKIPADADVVIAVSVSDMYMLLATYKGSAKLAYWARPYETWQSPRHKIATKMKKVLRRGGVVMCNSTWQVEEMQKKHDVKLELAYAGLDLHDWGVVDAERPRAKRIGCLYSAVECKQWNAFVALRKMLGDEFEYVAFGMRDCRDSFVKEYHKNPSHEELLALYHSCETFYCPNTREGFYNCGYEAALCGCILITSDYPCNGMGDYATSETAHVVSSVEQAAEAARSPDVFKIPKMLRRLTEIGDRKTNMERLVKLL
jgi:hypothetical protein